MYILIKMDELTSEKAKILALNERLKNFKRAITDPITSVEYLWGGEEVKNFLKKVEPFIKNIDSFCLENEKYCNILDNYLKAETEVETVYNDKYMGFE